MDWKILFNVGVGAPHSRVQTWYLGTIDLALGSAGAGTATKEERIFRRLARTQKVIVAIGASSSPRSVGAAVTRNLLEGGFAGDIHLVNRKGGELHGRPVLKSLADVPGVPDLAVVMTPAETVPGVLQELGAKGTKAVVIISAGPGAGADGHDDNERWRSKLLRIAQPHLLRIVGPNCIGYMAPRYGLNASFGPAKVKPGRLAEIGRASCRERVSSPV